MYQFSQSILFHTASRSLRMRIYHIHFSFINELLIILGTIELYLHGLLSFTLGFLLFLNSTLSM